MQVEWLAKSSGGRIPQLEVNLGYRGFDRIAKTNLIWYYSCCGGGFWIMSWCSIQSNTCDICKDEIQLHLRRQSNYMVYVPPKDAFGWQKHILNRNTLEPPKGAAGGVPPTTLDHRSCQGPWAAERRKVLLGWWQGVWGCSHQSSRCYALKYPYQDHTSKN